MRSHLWLSLLVAAPSFIVSAGCIADASVGYRATVVAPQPVVEVEEPAVEVEYAEPAAMVYVSPGVEVIEDYDYPVFFSGGLYYRQEGGVWYSSEYHDRGWAYNERVPTEVGRIERPEGYVHYRANVNARVGEPGYRHSDYARPTHRAAAPRYVEHPPHERGGQNVRGNYHGAERGRSESHAPAERGRTESHAPAERGRTESHAPAERGHTETHAPAERHETKPEHHDTKSNDKHHH